MKSGWKGKLIVVAGIGGTYLVARAIAKKTSEKESVDDGNPYLNISPLAGGRKSRVGIYESMVKPALDQVFSFGGLVVLSPLFCLISLAVYLDDPGPIIFTQKRIGKGKHYFMCHKFRSMKMFTPHDAPTHQLENPNQYITKVGRVLRRTSMDEIPQVWDIFRSKMSVIGPRPALWNQDDLVAEREKYGANDVMPGLTGLAQISGRDKLEIPDKARLDGEYVKNLSFLMDIRCFFGTVKSVIHHDGVVEGGTGTIRKIETPTVDEGGFEEYGCYKTFNIDRTLGKTVLIMGTDSYIGESFKAYCEEYYPNIKCDTMDMVDGSWRECSFKDKDGEPYDTVFHVAGIAHAEVGKVSDAEKEKYYEVNTDLAIECCKKTKADGVKQFIFMSSMIIYGGMEYIDEKTVPRPSNFYGNSKWLADKGVRAEANYKFKVAVLRPPMIYGKDSKGNYSMLSKIARKVPVFPRIDNQRSMLYIGNLCEFVCLVVLSGQGGVYFPQNGEYSSTDNVVQMIADVCGRRVCFGKFLTPAVSLAQKFPQKIGNLANKAFGSSYYDKRLSRYSGLDYQKYSLEDSIRLTECADR